MTGAGQTVPSHTTVLIESDHLEKDVPGRHANLVSSQVVLIFREFKRPAPTLFVLMISVLTGYEIIFDEG